MFQTLCTIAGWCFIISFTWSVIVYAALGALYLNHRFRKNKTIHQSARPTTTATRPHLVVGA